MTKPTGFAGIRDTLGQINNSMTFPHIDKGNNNRIYDKAVSPRPIDRSGDSLECVSTESTW